MIKIIVNLGGFIFIYREIRVSISLKAEPIAKMLSQEDGILGGFDIATKNFEALQGVLGNVLGPSFSDKLIGSFRDIFSIIHSAKFQFFSEVDFFAEASANIFNDSPPTFVESSAVHHQEEDQFSVESFLNVSADKINENSENSVDGGLLKTGVFINFFV